jgi:hypothetical protein
MRLITIILLFALFFAPFASAEIIFTKQPLEVYNLGDILETSILLTTNEGIYDDMHISLLCETHEERVSERRIYLEPNNQESLDEPIPLIKRFIGNSLGVCKIKAVLEGSIQSVVFSDEFEISNSLIVESGVEKAEYSPGEEVVVSGRVTKKNGNPVGGYVNMTLVLGDQKGNVTEDKNYEGTINQGSFLISFPLSQTLKAGSYLINLQVYEKDPLGEITSKGLNNHDISVIQVPTNLEVFFDNSEVEPGSDLKVKGILHDQSGEKINSVVILTVKDENNKILEQIEKATDEFFEFPIEYNEPPEEWSVVAVSNKITSEAPFNITMNEKVEFEVVNETLILTNVGNIFYNKTVVVKLGEETINIKPELELDEIKKYSLSAPDGEYEFEILSDGGESRITGSVILTGRAVGVKKLSGLGVLLVYPIAWLFIFLVLGFVGFMLYRKGFKKTLLGKISRFRSKEKSIFNSEGKTDSVSSANKKAEMSLSIKGDKQTVSMVAINLKNHEDIKKNSGVVEETFDKIISVAEESDAYLYKNKENLFFILAPLITKTFKNENAALQISQKVVETIKNHNKLSKQKIDFGIGINNGDIVATLDGNVLKFMAFGHLLTDSKKISSLSKGEIYLSKTFRERTPSGVKTKKIEGEKTEAYKVQSVKENPEKHKKFISEFIKRLEGNGKGKKDDKKNSVKKED